MNALNDRVTPARQMDVLRAIHDYYKRHGHAPGIREMGAALGLRSTSTIHYHLTGLAAAGLVRWDKLKNRAVTITEAGYAELKEVPPFGAVPDFDKFVALRVLMESGISEAEYAALAKAVRA